MSYLYFPGSSDPQVIAMTSAEEGKRQSYIHELINTEETYMNDMSIVLEVRVCPNMPSLWGWKHKGTEM